MANLGDLKAFWTATDFEQGETITFADAGDIEDVDFSREHDGSKRKKVFQITIRKENQQKKFTLNKTSIDVLSLAWGKKTEEWIGKKATVNFLEQMSFGKMARVLVFKPIL